MEEKRRRMTERNLADGKCGLWNVSIEGIIDSHCHIVKEKEKNDGDGGEEWQRGTWRTGNVVCGTCPLKVSSIRMVISS